jgi:hypothetical protein
MLSCAWRRQALLAGTVVACLLSVAVLLVGVGVGFGFGGSAVAQPSPTPAYQTLLPLARGRLLVSIGTPPQWLPESGVSTSLTLFSGGPANRDAASDTAYIALQNAGRRCAATPAKDRVTLLTIPVYYASANLISSQRRSPFAGAPSGDYAVTLPSIVIHQHGRLRVCVWLAQRPTARGLVLSQRIRLLNGVFAASVSAVPSASTGVGATYTLDAVDVGRTFNYAATTVQCGTHYADASGSVADGQLATESIAFETNPCAGDGTTFAFTLAGGQPLATLSYTEAQAVAAPPQIASIGACELDPVDLTSLASATAYVEAVGCSVRRLLVAPYNAGLPRGAVIEAQVDGGLAQVAPRGTAVDLELNGRPVSAATSHR